jgi:major membrane immunogen (membrane-anchored lipoprotein)
MKKVVSILLFFIIGFFSLAAMKDGSYSVEGRAAGGWQPFMKMTVKNEKIINVQYDRKNTQGQLLSMEDKNFREGSFALSRSLKSTQNANTVESISNSELTNEFKTMANFLINKANAGQTGDFTLN